MYNGDIYCEKLTYSNAILHSMCSQLRHQNYYQPMTLKFYLFSGNNLLENFSFLNIKYRIMYRTPSICQVYCWNEE